MLWQTTATNSITRYDRALFQPVTILSTFKATAPLSKACRLNTPQNVPTCKKDTNDYAEF